MCHLLADGTLPEKVTTRSTNKILDIYGTSHFLADGTLPRKVSTRNIVKY
jgi:hypothetical protein